MAYGECYLQPHNIWTITCVISSDQGRGWMWWSRVLVLWLSMEMDMRAERGAKSGKSLQQQQKRKKKRAQIDKSSITAPPSAFLSAWRAILGAFQRDDGTEGSRGGRYVSLLCVRDGGRPCQRAEITNHGEVSCMASRSKCNVTVRGASSWLL